MLAPAPRSILRSAVVVAFLVSGLIPREAALGAPAVRAPGAADLTPAVETLAKYLVQAPDLTNDLHAKIGYAPPGNASAQMKAMPAFRRIEEAYLAAERVAPGDGGKHYLAMMSRALAQQYNSARAESALTPYLAVAESTGTEPPSTLKFDYRRTGSKVIEIPEQARAAIRTLSRYATGNSMGSPEVILSKHFGMSVDRSEAIARASRSTKDCLLRGLREVATPERDAGLRRLTDDVIKTYRSAVWEPSLRSYLPDAVKSEVTRLEQLIKDLQSRDEATVYVASEKLAAQGRSQGKREAVVDLQPKHIRQMVAQMRNSPTSWTRRLRREGHCTWYEWTSARYYAAKAIAEMRSPQVSKEVLAEATRNCSKYAPRDEKETDPGWI